MDRELCLRPGRKGLQSKLCMEELHQQYAGGIVKGNAVCSQWVTLKGH